MINNDKIYICRYEVEAKDRHYNEWIKNSLEEEMSEDESIQDANDVSSLS